MMGSRVLLADDSVTIQKVVGIIFANEDYELTVVGNGDAALQKAREIMPDVMLIDALMPGKNGYEVCSEIRRDPQLSHISLLLMTGAFEVVDEEKNRQCGADDFITKPFESQALIDMTARLIALSRERASRPAAAAVVPPPVQPAPQPAAAAPVAPAPVEAIAPPQAAAPAADIWDEGFDTGFAEEAPAVQPQAAPVAAASDDDLWGVFDMEAVESQPAAVPAAQPQVAPSAAPAGEDFFSFDEEPAPAVAEPAVVPGAATGFEPFGEQEFSLGEIAPVEEASTPLEEDFSTISFDEPAPAPPVQPVAPPVMSTPPQEPPAPVVAPPVVAPEPVPPVVSAPPAPQPAPAPAAAPAALDEEQLKMLLSKVSRDVIEKIVWEVVPDLAESIIREEIRKIKEGIGR
ncbi:MAG TPA: response regulator [Geobacteraceae bacterium]|nr:response regulator [Geobacteraceae bacterium]